MRPDQLTIVFDLGGVLIDWNPRYLFRKVFSDHEDMEFFLTNVCNQKWNEKQDAGRKFSEAILELKEKFPQYQSQIQIYFDRWPEMLGERIENNYQAFMALRKEGYKVYALSNWSSETFPAAQQKFKFLDEFHGRLISGQEGLKKPDKKFFELLLSRYQLDAKQSLFIDDVLENIEAAQSLGFETVHINGNVNLLEHLKKRGLI